MPRYNIAFYSDTYLPAVDGVVTSMLTFKKELERRGCKVYIFASRRAIKGKKYVSPSVFLYPGVGFKPYPQYSVALFPYYSALKLRSLDIDVVHAQTPFIMGFNSLLAAKLGRYPLIGSFHTLINSKSLSSYYPKNRHLKKFYAKYLWKYTKYFYKMCDCTIAPSQAIASLLENHGISGVNVVPNSVDLSRFNPSVRGDAMRERLGIGEDEKMVLYLGRISREKKVDVMLRAAKALSRTRKDVYFIIGGTGPAADYYKRTAKRLGILDRVRFLGFVDDKDLPSLYAASNLLCLPSANFETQGIVAIEAMAVGKPVVGSDSLALSELIENSKNGEKFKTGDYIGCSRKIEKVLNNCDAYKRSAISTSRTFSVEKVTDRLLKVYDSVLTEQAIY